MKTPTIIEFINKAEYDQDGQKIWRVSGKGEYQMLVDVRGWGAIQNMFDNMGEARKFQDKIGAFVTDAINEKVERESETPYSEFERFNKAHADFVKKTFPQITDFRGPLRHLKKEVDEAIDSGAPEEFADILMLLLSAFRLRFPEKNTTGLLDMCREKLGQVLDRQWGEMNEEGFVEHKKETP